jgi:hypothetical protein
LIVFHQCLETSAVFTLLKNHLVICKFNTKVTQSHSKSLIQSDLDIAKKNKYIYKVLRRSKTKSSDIFRQHPGEGMRLKTSEDTIKTTEDD